MASRVAEVIYKLKDLFTGPAKKVGAGYDRIRESSRKTARSVARDSQSIGRNLGNLEGGVAKLIGSWKALAAAAGGVSIAGTFKSIVDEADRVGKAASKIGLTTEALSRLSFAASRENIDFGALEVGLQRMTRRIGAARTGSAELQKVFSQLGLDVEELAALSPDEAFLKIADATRAVTNEKEQLALFFKIFDTEGVNLIRLARQGSDGIRALGDEAERLGKVFGSDFTENAARFKDALTDLDARITGQKINAFTPVLEELTEFLDNVGLGDKIKGLETELLLLEERLKKPIVFDRRGVERRAASIRSELTLIARRRQSAKEESEEEQKIAMERMAANKAFMAEVDELTDDYTAAAKERTAALKKEQSEHAKARQDQATIESEFKNLVDEITEPEQKDVFLLDVFNQINKATRALETENLDEAIRLSRQGGDLLGQLKEKGTESELVLKFLAERLGSVANEAAKKRTAAELVDVQAAEQQLDGVKNKLEALKGDAVTQGTEIGRALVAAIQAEVSQTTITLPQIEQPQIPLPAVVQQGINDYRNELNKRSPK